MTVRRLRAKQRGPMCSWCLERATHRGVFFTRFACPEHLDALEELDRRETAPDDSDAAFYGGF